MYSPLASSWLKIGSGVGGFEVGAVKYDRPAGRGRGRVIACTNLGAKVRGRESETRLRRVVVALCKTPDCRPVHFAKLLIPHRENFPHALELHHLQRATSKAASTMASTVLGKRSRRTVDAEGTTRAFLRQERPVLTRVQKARSHSQRENDRLATQHYTFMKMHKMHSKIQSPWSWTLQTPRVSSRRNIPFETNTHHPHLTTTRTFRLRKTLEAPSSSRLLVRRDSKTLSRAPSHPSIASDWAVALSLRLAPRGQPIHRHRRATRSSQLRDICLFTLVAHASLLVETRNEHNFETSSPQRSSRDPVAARTSAVLPGLVKVP